MTGSGQIRGRRETLIERARYLVFPFPRARQYISIYFIKTEQIKKEEQKSKKKKSHFLFKDI
jgi:hypothetical protein